MATHFSILAWRVPQTEEPGGLPSVGSETWTQLSKFHFHCLGWDDPLEEGTAAHSSILASRIHGQRSLAGYSPWGCKQLDTAEVN